MDERQSTGRRTSDALFSRSVKIVGASGTFLLVVIAAAFKIYAQTQDYPRLKADVDSLKIVVRAVPQIVEQVNRIDARIAEMYCSQVPPEKRAGCR